MEIRIRLLLIALPFLLISFAPADVSAEWDVDGLEELLPHHETDAERLRWLGREDEMPRRETLSDPPPLAPIRNCAEWEPCTGVLIRYPLGLPYNLLRDFDDDVVLHVVVSSSYQSSAISNLTSQGIDMGQVQWLVRNNDSIWTRDYGPWFVFDGDDQLSIIDHTYNRPRPNDNLIPIYLGQQLRIPVYSHDMYHAGGNYMTDGSHISSSTELVYNEAASHNGMNQTQVDQLMFDYYGVATYNVLDYIESGGIHHIDTWAKFLDEENVLVKEVWTSHWTYNTLNQRATLLASLPSSTGRNYQVHRVYCYNIGGSSPASYTNSLILNQTIYVPTFGNATYDDDALATYEAAAPGYDVRGYYHGGFLSDDALHCRAKGVMDSLMLRVEHIPVLEDQDGNIEIVAAIEDHSDLGISAAETHYRQDGGSWNVVAMTDLGGDAYSGTIPAPAVNTTTDYYIHAESNSGRSEGMPRVEPAHWYSFLHNADPVDAPNSPEFPFGTRTVISQRSHPNPFRGVTSFSFELAYSDDVELSVFDSQGRKVRDLIHGQRPAGWNEVEWDGSDNQGRSLPAGVYRFRLRVAGLEYSRPATLIR